jgi:hypothetical protein
MLWYGYVGRVFSYTGGMGNIRSSAGMVGEYEGGNGSPFLRNKLHLLYYYFVALLKKDMSTVCA